MKRLLLSFSLLLLPMLVNANYLIDGIYYEVEDRTYTAKVTAKYKEEIGTDDYYYVSDYSGSVVIPSTISFFYAGKGQKTTFRVTSIDECAFYKCDGLTSVTIPNSVTSIRNFAFQYCTGLRELNIPSSVTYIGTNVFYGCTGLTSIVVEEENTKFDSRNNCNAIIESESNNLFLGCKNTVIPISVTSIGRFAFCNCSGLTSISIPKYVTSIGDNAFSSCSELKSVTIPNNVETIGSSAFANCSEMQSVTIGSNVKSIGTNAFYGCGSLTDLYCKAIIVPDVATSKALENVTLYVPSALIESYSNNPFWSGFKIILPLAEEGQGGDNQEDDGQEIEICATPTISFVKGEFVFNCETKGVTFHYEISRSSSGSTTGSSSGTANKITAYTPTSVTVTVYATKTGYQRSGTVTATYTGIFGDLNGDGEVNVGDHVELTNIIMAP